MRWIAAGLYVIALISMVGWQNSPPQPEIINLSQDVETGDYAPVWSADGQSILFYQEHQEADGKSRAAFYSVSLTTGDKDRLFEINSLVSGVVWSPDRRYLAYMTRDSIVHIVDQAGTLYQQIEGTTNSAGIHWSPDSTYLLVARDQAMLTVNIHTQEERQIASARPETSLFNYNVAWSPDGKHILMVVSGDIYLFNSDGSGEINLTQSEAQDTAPNWSPDGTQIVFTSDGNYDTQPEDTSYFSNLYVINSDGSEIKRLTHARHSDNCPVWSPDGNSLAFARGTLENRVLFLLDMETQAVSWLPRPEGKSSGCPQWSPDGNWLTLSADVIGGDTEVYAAARTAFQQEITEQTLVHRVTFLDEGTALKVYASPDPQAEVVTTLSNGTILPAVLDTVDAAWVEVAYAPRQTGWIERQYMASNLDPMLFCEDTRLHDLISTLQTAVRERDSARLASLVSPRGLYLSMEWYGNVYLMPAEVQSFFEDEQERELGNYFSGEAIIGTIKADVVPQMRRDLLPENISIACDYNQDTLSEGNLYGLAIPGYEIDNFYTIMRPGAPGFELDWGAWGLTIEYWQGEPKLLGLNYYQWTP